ncbi:MAG: histidine kinase [Candidatus Eisenbacteria bacterium]|uniref:Histidine kinase n=1 Tax=Eiseniibacteriota bacterium TaxID=2212470 RepID=A0A948RW26_UNCEI|nr:histidine kinase [Candidatus Eisenbacteria bacterium]MBU1948390.1 histidine kinase [Candidatus Eisenbacteria bacterium]MBU2692088.1 histidine kinase [Candidatus Eisenbacteria bacterium]
MVRYKTLEEIAGHLEKKRISFSSLMPWRISNILLVSSLYDSFTFQEDGNLTEMLFSEYLDLNLSYAPSISRVSTAEAALENVRTEQPDLIISMLRVGDTDIFEFGKALREIAPDLPLVLLAYDTRELAMLKAREPIPGVDHIFVWQGDVRLFLAIIKCYEDVMNARHDAEVAGVKTIILIEDNARFYSSYLPLLYTEIMEQTQGLMTEGVNRMQRLLRMRARPKILWSASYEGGLESYERYRDHILGVIVDARFPKNGKIDPSAGLQFAKMVKTHDIRTPVLMQSSDTSNRDKASATGSTFIDKNSPTLLHDVQEFMRNYLGFGDFIFRHPDESEIMRASDLRGLTRGLKRVPDDSILHHAQRNDFSTWLMARTEYDLAKALRPRKPEEFKSPAALREYLVQTLRDYRDQSRAGLVEEFSTDSFEAEEGFTKIGSGSLGGKGRGLAFLNSLLKDYDIEDRFAGIKISVPPSTVLATGVFDKFMEESNLTQLALNESDDDKIREAFLKARLPEKTSQALRAYLQEVTYPLAVRSSSLLEDASYQPFAGIFQTFMLPNNNEDIEIRLDELCRAIRLVYASTYYNDSKSYIESTPNRLEEEKMAVVIQQIVGRQHDHYVYPNFAGVARSYDYYPMEGMKAEDGVASIALGLGSMVVDGGMAVRFSPSQPQRLYQFSSTKDYLKNSQREFYGLDLQRPGPTGSADEPVKSNLVLLDLGTALKHGTLDAVGSVYSPQNDKIYEGVHRKGISLVSMAGVLTGTHFPLPEVLRFILDVGVAGFSCHVEMEFAVTLHPSKEEPHEFACLQIRPLVFSTVSEAINIGETPKDQIICMSGSALGHGRFTGIRDIIYIRDEDFDRSQTKEIANEVGLLNRQLRQAGRPYLLIGPGRWGSADPWLGIPVTWSQISGVRCIVESEMKDIQIAPSQGTHFFQNITSFGIGYFTMNSQDPISFINQTWLNEQPAAWETETIRHIAFSESFEIVVDSRSGKGAVFQPGWSLTRESGSSSS